MQAATVATHHNPTTTPRLSDVWSLEELIEGLTPRPQDAMLKAALDYALRGWAVFRLAPGSKVPIKGSHGFKDATTDALIILDWWEETPDANIGLATGHVSNLTVIDIDPRSGGDLTLAALEAEHDALPWTTAVLTGRGDGGRHLYFQHTYLISNTLGTGIDIKSDSGYVVAPPSVHPDTHKPYVWQASEHGIAELPAWLATATPSHSPLPEGDKRNTSLVPQVAEEWHRGLEADVACARALGLPVRSDGTSPAFSCTLPGHGPDTQPSAALFMGRGGDILYHCFHRRGEDTLPLPAVRASLAYGRVVKGEGELAAWRLRLLCEAGAVVPADVPHRALSDDAPQSAKAVYEGFLLRLGLNWLRWPGNGTTFSWRFASAWCGVSDKTAKYGLIWLMKEGYIRSVGKARGRFGRDSHVLRPVDPLELADSLLDGGEYGKDDIAV